MQDWDLLLLIFIGLAIHNANHFEKKIEEGRKAIRDLIKAKDVMVKHGLAESIEFKKIADDIELTETAIEFYGNWFPSRYRQLIISVVGSGIVRGIFGSPTTAIAYFLIACLFTTTGALKFWLGLFVKNK